MGTLAGKWPWTGPSTSWTGWASAAPSRARSYPHEFSGGMRQRVMIAMALSCSPEILIADEPTTALDVTTQAQILAEIETLREQTGVGVLLITHDLGVISEVADRVVVMYAGRVVEQGTVEEIFYDPRHPYTWGLLGSAPRLDRARPSACRPSRAPHLRCCTHRSGAISPPAAPGGPRLAARCPSSRATTPRPATTWPVAGSSSAWPGNAGSWAGR